MNPILYTIITIVIGLVMLAAGYAGGVYISRVQAEKKRLEEASKAKGIIQEATDRAAKVELDARDRALKIVQSADSDLTQRRNELNRETERLDRRRAELDSRVERLEQREQTMNKRQSNIDRRANEVEKVHELQMAKLQEIAQMTPEDARKILLDEVEKDARNDMARIIRQIEAEA